MRKMSGGVAAWRGGEVVKKYFPPRHHVATPPLLAVAVSGGADSLALAVLLQEAGANLVALTVDHGLRPESGREAKAVGAILGKRQIPHEILAVSTKVPSGNMMEWAREQRYKLLLAYCKKHHIDTLYVAHHQDDQVETFFLNLERGSGLKGLSGMRAVSEQQGIRIIRPLLSIPKSELRAYLKARKIKPIEDPTNRNTDYKRNRLRQLLGQAFPENQELPGRITQAMAHLAQAEGFIAERATTALGEVVHFEKKPAATIDAAAFAALHPLLQYRVLLSVLLQLSAKKKPPRSEALLALLTRIKQGEKAFTLHGVKGARKAAIWRLIREEKKLPRA